MSILRFHIFFNSCVFLFLLLCITLKSLNGCFIYHTKEKPRNYSTFTFFHFCESGIYLDSFILSSLFYFVEIQSSRLSSKCLFNLWHQRETKELSNFQCFSKSWNCSNSKVSFTFLKFNFIVSACLLNPIGPSADKLIAQLDNLLLLVGYLSIIYIWQPRFLSDPGILNQLNTNWWLCQ